MGTAVAAAAAGMALQGFSTIYGASQEQKKQQEQGAIDAEYVLGTSKAEALGLQHQAEEADRMAKIGRIQADQISADYRNDLSTTISNIRAIRASTNAAVDSPSSRAVIANEEKVSERTMRIRAGAALTQAGQSESDALFYRTSAKASLLRGQTTADSIRRMAGKGVLQAGIIKAVGGAGSYLTTKYG